MLDKKHGNVIIPLESLSQCNETGLKCLIRKNFKEAEEIDDESLLKHFKIDAFNFMCVYYIFIRKVC